MLTESDIIAYLLERELIDYESIVDSDLLVIDASRRNHNFHVLSGRGPSYLVKQGTDTKASMIAREAKIYQTLVAGSLGPQVSQYLPQCYIYDPEEDILILEFLRDAEDARAYHLRTRRFPINLARAIGRSLGVLHRLPPEALPEEAGQEKLLSLEPAAFYVDRPSLVLLHEFSQACIELVQLIQKSSEMRQLLDDVRQDWRTEAFIHHDVRWDNMLVVKSATSKRIELKLVDWESAGLGDPCWDVGSAFGDYLTAWLGSVPVSGDAPPDRYLKLAQYPLNTVQPALGALWQAYVREMGLDATESGEWLVRSTRYAGLKVIQSGFEQMQGVSQWTPAAICHVQVGLDMLQRPELSAVSLLGIPIRREMSVRALGVPVLQEVSMR